MMTALRMRRDAARRDDGVYAILFALLVVVLVGMAALVLDLALVRESRADTRSAADSAAVAGAALLDDAWGSAKGSPRKACEAAWQYLRGTLTDLGDGSSSCASLPDTSASCLPPTPPTFVADWTGAPYRVVVTWPVLNTSHLMTQPDVAPAFPSQGIETVQDGKNPCSRLGVEVYRDNQLALGGVFGIGESTTRAASVARSRATDPDQIGYAALNILEPAKCQALWISNGSITVGTTLRPGFIAVESSATDATCGSSSPYAIDVSATNTGKLTAAGNGLIQSYALNSYSGNPARSYTSYPGTNANIHPTPVLLPERYGTKPVTDTYGCTSASGCGVTYGANYIGALRTAIGTSGVPTGYTQITPGAGNIYGLTSCTMSPSTPVVIPSGKWVINCPNTFNGRGAINGGGFAVNSGAVVFRGGTVVFNGQVTLGSSGCLAINVNGSVCPTIVPGTVSQKITTNPAPADDGMMYIRSGPLTKGSQASFYAPQTFVYLADTTYGTVNLGGGGNGALLMTAPLATTCNGSLQCAYQRFVKIALWAEASGSMTMGGASSFGLRGVLYTPNAPFEFTGQAPLTGQSAQFWARTLKMSGQGTLILDPDPDASIARPVTGVTLIR